ncbi:MAG: DUF4105 domain-containing protein [Sphaerochaetaceae bacterium]|jgi:hypothetical protein
MLKKAVLATIFITLIFNPLCSASFTKEKYDDPNSSEKLLQYRDFDVPLSEQQRSLADNLQVNLITMGKGDQLYVWFGHTGIEIKDLISGQSVMYDFGIFSFNQGFYQTFALGNLNYEIWATSTEMRKQIAINEKRDISIVELNLSPEAKIAILETLNYTVEEPNNVYRYHHYYENCSTRIRDIIDKGVGGQLKAYSEAIDEKSTLRKNVVRHTYASMFINWVLNFAQNGKIDYPINRWEAMFLPSVLEDTIREFNYVDENGSLVPLAKSYTVVNKEPVGYRSPVLSTYQSQFFKYLVFGLLAGLVSLILKFLRLNKLRGFYTFVIYLFFAAVSSILLFMMVATNHDVTYFNENILFISPYLFVLAIQALVGGFGKSKSFKKGNFIYTFLFLLLLIIKSSFSPIFAQQNYEAIVVLLPLLLANLF